MNGFRKVGEIEVQASEYLAGSKIATRIGDGPVFVSPAMYDLMKHASPDELQRLLAKIKVLQLPDVYAVDMVPMTVMAPTGPSPTLPQRYMSPEGRHRHECVACLHVWEHDDDDGARSDPDHLLAHACPACGAFERAQLAKYFGDRPPGPAA